jgi:hypothetical protein
MIASVVIAVARVAGDDSRRGAGTNEFRNGKAVRELLAEIDAGAGDAFLKERDEQRRDWEESIQMQILEMSLQSEHRPGEAPAEDLEEEEDLGHSFG